MPDTLRAALALAARGLWVLPLSPGMKRPARGGHGSRDAVREPDAVREAWRRAGEGAGLGIASGPWPDGRWLWVLDLDTHPPAGVQGISGPEALAWWMDRGCTIPGGLAAETPRGGLHLYLLAPVRVPARAAGHPLPDGTRTGCDVRGDGHYVVAPPTVTHREQHGGVYRWLTRGIGPADTPRWLLDWIMPPPPPPPAPRCRYTGDHPYAVAVLEGRARDVQAAGEGGRTVAVLQSATICAHYVAGGHLGEQRVREVLEDVALAVGVRRRDVRRAIDRGIAAGLTSPWHPPER